MRSLRLLLVPSFVVVSVLSTSGPLQAQGPSGTWTPFAPIEHLLFHSAIYDPVRDRMLIFGGDDEVVTRADVWVVELAGPTRPRVLLTLGTAPPARSQHAAVYDPVRDRMIVFAGSGGSFGGPPGFADTWALDLSGVPTWSLLAATPPPQLGSNRGSIVYDSFRDRILLFTINSATGATGVWEMDLSVAPSWVPLVTAGTSPPAAFGRAIYDAPRDRAVYFVGGSSGTFELQLSGTPTWNPIATVGATPPAVGPTTFVPANDLMVVNDGSNWHLSLTGTPTWTEVAPGGTHQGTNAAIYDPVRNRMVIQGGRFVVSSGSGLTLWYYPEILEMELAVQTWVDVTPIAPHARSGGSAVYDQAGQRGILFGGYYSDDMERLLDFNDAWSLTLGNDLEWSRISATGDVPDPRSLHAAVYVPGRAQMITYGGVRAADAFGLADIHVLDLSGPPTWTGLATAGVSPGVRYGHVAIYDPVRDRMIVHGGHNQFANATGQTHALDLSGTPTWSVLVTGAPTPPSRAGHAAAYDDLRDRMIVYGGARNWNEHNGWPSELMRDDAWALSFSPTPSWSKIVTTGPTPVARAGATALYDRVRDRLVVFGGSDSVGTRFNEVWALSLSGTPGWTQLSPSGAIGGRGSPVAFHDRSGDRLVVFGGMGICIWPGHLECLPHIYGDAWTLSFTAPPLAVGGTVSGVLRLSAAFPNPTPRGASVTLDLPEAGEISAGVYDVTGRELKRFGARALPAGRHRLDWDGATRDGRKAAPGVYFMRVDTGSLSARRRIVLLR